MSSNPIVTAVQAVTANNLVKNNAPFSNTRGGGAGGNRNRAAETKAFIDAVKQDTSISDITRKELMSGATKQLDAFTASQPKLQQLNIEIGQLQTNLNNPALSNDADREKLKNLIEEQKKLMGSGSTFDASAASLRTELNAAKEGSAPKFKYRQALEKKRQLMVDRPGQKQTIFSRGR